MITTEDILPGDIISLNRFAKSEKDKAAAAKAAAAKPENKNKKNTNQVSSHIDQPSDVVPCDCVILSVS